MEYLPIVIFEIVLFVFLAFAALAGILFQQIENKNEKIIELDEFKTDSELKGIELCKWVALARNFGCQSQSELCMMINSMKNQVDFLCKNRSHADPQYVDEWFRFKKMFL